MCLAAELNSLAKYLHWKQIYGSENVRLHKMLHKDGTLHNSKVEDTLSLFRDKH